MLHMREGRNDLIGRMPIKRTHREIVVFVLPNGELLFEILKGKELMRGVKIFVIFAVAALNLSIVTRCVNFY